MLEFMAVAKALADESRARLLAALQGRELCVCQLIELVGLAPSTVSRHLSILYNARLIEGRKKGRWMYYRSADEQAPDASKLALAWVLACLKNEPMIRADQQRLEQIVKDNPDALCRSKAARAMPGHTLE